MENRKIKILAIDDNRENLATLKALMMDAFSEVVVFTATRGQQGLELAAIEDPDVILLGNYMPGMDGFEVCTRLKADKKLRDIPVVFVTAVNGVKESRVKALECGAEAFLSKPVDEIELTAQVRAMLKIRDANIRIRDEKELLAALVEEKTRELNDSNIKTLQLFEAVKREQTLIEAIFDSIPGYLYVYDESGRLIKWNKKHETMTGFSTEELSHMTLEQWFDQEDIIRVNAAVHDVFEKGYGEVEAQLILKNGEKMMIRSSGVPLILDGHKYFTGIGVDITEQKRVQEALLESQSILKAAFENIEAGIAIADTPNGKLRYVNKAGLLIINKTEEEIVKNIDMHSYVDSWGILHFDGTPYATDEVPLTRAILYGETCSKEFIIRRDGFEDRYVLANAAPIKDSDNNIKAGIVVFLDITERRKAEVLLQQNMDDLLESQRIAHLGTWRLNVATNQVVWSEELYQMYGFDPTIPPPPYTDHMKLFTPESWDKLSTSLEQARTSGIPYELELETVTKDGLNGWMWVRGEAVKDSNGNITGLRGAAQDISQRKKFEDEIKQSEEKYQLLFNKAPLGYQSLDIEGRFIEVNQQWLDTLGYSKEEVIGEWFGNFICPEYVDRFHQHFSIFKAQGYIHSEFEMLSKDGQRLFVSFEGTIGHNAEGEFKQTHCIVQDITERRKAENELLFLSYHDHLTGLYNRRYFEQEIKRLDTKKNLPLSIIMCDVNGLKLVNDSFGHDSGDALLINAAEIIRKACREGDVIARIGGDEFVILLPKTAADETAKIANHIIELASKEVVANIKLSISYGYDTKTTVSQLIAEIMVNAENHMYRHKLYERSSIKSKTIDLIMNTLFEKSDREAAHSNRVGSICQAIAAKMNLDKDAVNQMKIAGLIHDIGKIGIDEKILNKPGNLTITERNDIERHPEIGWRLLSSTKEFSELARFVLNHHEKWDGSGYPNGLKGEEIQLEARIISVADAYDAMTSVRSYRKGLSTEEAIKELTRGSGTQFDPGIVDVFVNQVLSDNMRLEMS